MTWSYSGDPSSTLLDQTRFLCGDTNSDDQQLSNEEINYLLTQWEDDPYIAAAEGCIAIAGKYAMKADSSRSVGDVSLSTQYAATVKTLYERSSQLRQQGDRLNVGAVNFYTDDDGNVFGPMNFSVGMDAYDD